MSYLVGIPKGVYIWGSVGGGKTMLMDMFYDVAPVRRKLRVHFHSFMSDVHTKIHRVKQATVSNRIKGGEVDGDKLWIFVLVWLG